MELKNQLYINGVWRDGSSGKMRPVINPFNAETIREVHEANDQDTRDAIAAARTAFDSGPWPGMSNAERKDLLYKLAARLEKEKKHFAELESLNTGKTQEESLWDMDDVIGVFRYYADLALGLEAETLKSPIENTGSTLLREPIGVVAMICPWNYPLLQASWKMGPALATGCTFVLKPSELTPLTGIEITRLCEEVGYPPGVINLVMGAGQVVGHELSLSDQVDMVSFTGGIVTGRKIMAAATGNMKKVALELGGKNPNIVFADADLETAVDYALNAVFFHAGQICSAGARLLLEEPIHDEFVERLKVKMQKIRLGNGLEEGTEMGPVISAEHRAKIESYIKIAQDEKARLLLGGRRPADEKLSKGFFLEPTLFTDCTSEMRIVNEEVFGPLITVEKFSDEDAVIELVNASPYGLSAGFWTKDKERIKRVSKKIRYGTVWVNDFNVYFAQAPWGGYRTSGIGRELGPEGLSEYLEVKHVFENFDAKPLNFFSKTGV